MKYKLQIMKKTILLLAITFSSLSIFSQHKISGKIIDEQKQSLPFANIVLYKVGEETKPLGTISNDDGTFILDNINSGKYKLEVSMLGFQSFIEKEFDLNNDKTFHIVLKEETQMLNEVVVKSKRPVINKQQKNLL